MAIKNKQIEIYNNDGWRLLHSAVIKRYKVVITEGFDVELKIIKNAVNHDKLGTVGTVVVEKKWTSPWGAVRVRYNGDVFPKRIKYTVYSGSNFDDV